MAYVRWPWREARFLVGIGCGLAALWLAGCQNDEIRTYQVPRVESPRPIEAARATRMLAAILPHGDRTWYFKLTGAPQAVEEHKNEFREFVQSSRFSKDPDQPLAWSKIPEQWQAKPKSGISYATFHVGPAESSLELTVTPLGRESGSVLDNVNRWRRQLSLAPVDDAELPKVVEEVKIGDATADFVDMTGMASAAGKMGSPPFAGGGTLTPPFASNVERPRSGDAKPPKYTKPEGWSPTTAAMSVGSFQVGQGEQSAMVTMTPLPGKAGGLVANVNRWRQQIGLAPAAEEQILKESRPVEVAGVRGYSIDLVGPESAGSQRQAIVAVTFERDALQWFVKIKGNAGVVAKEKPNFEAFVKSIQFDSASGAQP